MCKVNRMSLITCQNYLDESLFEKLFLFVFSECECATEI